MVVLHVSSKGICIFPKREDFVLFTIDENVKKVINIILVLTYNVFSFKKIVKSNYVDLINLISTNVH